MAGPNTPQIKGNKQYGDETALNRLAISGSGLSQSNADYIPSERRGVGRPAGTQAGQAIPQVQQGAPGVPAEHRVLMEDFSRAALVAQVGAAAVQDAMAGPWIRTYAQLASEDVERKGESLKRQTPNFE